MTKMVYIPMSNREKHNTMITAKAPFKIISVDADRRERQLAKELVPSGLPYIDGEDYRYWR